MTPAYSEEFKARMVQKLTAPGGPSATAVSSEVGVPQPTLSRWVREAGRVDGMAKTRRKKGGGGGDSKRRRPQDWTSEEKLQAVLETASLNEEDVGGYLRQRGLHRVTLERWRKQVLLGLETSLRSGSKSSAETRKIRSLEKEIQRKDKALAEAAALLVLQKKVRAIWGDEDDDTTPRSGR